MTPNALAAYRSDTAKLAKYAISPTQVCTSCHKSRSITQYKPGGTRCARCRWVR